MRSREKEFCRTMAVYGDPVRAAEKAGYRNPEKAWTELISREEIAGEIRRLSENIRSVYESTAVCGLYRLAYGGISDPMELVYRDDLSSRELSGLDLMNVAEIKRTKDKSIEIKFFDRIKAADKLNELLSADSSGSGGSGLLEAMRLSAEAIGRMNGVSEDEL